MREKLKEEISNLTLEEAEQLFDSLKNIFKGGVEIVNLEDKDQAMTEYYKSILC
jgi:inorganic pyrophosphatase